jgi:hypothetical protein
LILTDGLGQGVTGIPLAFSVNIHKVMSKILQFASLLLLLIPSAEASSPCPVTLLSGTGGQDSFSVTFRQTARLPIRRLELNCNVGNGNTRVNKAQQLRCWERNADFMPNMVYTVDYTYGGSQPRSIAVSVRSVTFSDGSIWKPSHRETCRALTIFPSKLKSAK